MPNNCWFLAVAWLWVCAPSSSLAATASTNRSASTPFIIDVWETGDGLPQSSVITMAQTREGYLWLGTLKGLVRFDGLRFTVFDHNNTPGLGSSEIVHLFEDSQRRLWIGTRTTGIVMMKDGRVTRPAEINQGEGERRLIGACEDASGGVWLYCANGELWRHHDGRFTPCLLVPFEASAPRSVIMERNGRVWVATERRQGAVSPVAGDGLVELPLTQIVPASKLDLLLARRHEGYWRLADGRIETWVSQRREREWGTYPWGLASFSTAVEDREGNLVVGTRGAGLFWMDAQGQASRVSTTEGLSHNYVLSLLVDREGTLWVGTDGGGLNRVKRQLFETLEAAHGTVVQSVSEDDQGGLWSGANSGGVSYWKDGAHQRYLPTISVRAVFVDRTQRVWVGTRGFGLYQFQSGQFQRAVGAGSLHPEINAIYQDRTGRLWVGTAGGLGYLEADGWKTFTTQHGLSSDAVTSIAEDAEGNLWIGTESGGLNRWRDGQFTVFRKDARGPPSDHITALMVDGQGVLWVGTSSGLARWQTGRWTRYSTREGLISDSIGYLLQDGRGDLWIGSNWGLMRVARKDLAEFAHGRNAFIPCRTYREEDGLPTVECSFGSQPAACLTREGKLWFPTTKGLVSVDPARLVSNTNPPPVLIESVLIDGEKLTRSAAESSVTLSADKERLEIHYTSLNLSAPERARFIYRLEGHETDWIDAGNSRVVRYSKLPPGDYQFQVTACNEDGVWNNAGASLALVVQPPFWRTWWFISAMAVGLLGIIVGLVHFFLTQRLQRQVAILRQQEAVEKERARIARDIHDQLGASLTQVALLGELVQSDKTEPAEVEAHARQITQTARDTSRTLDEIVWTVNPSNDTLEGLVNYVCKYAQDYLAVAGLRYRLEVPPQLPDVSIAPEVRHNVFLASKEAITNVVRHAQARSAWVRVRLETNRFVLEIADDGRGLSGMDEKRAATRSGLRNLRQRMEDIGGEFSMSTSPEGGLLIRLAAPLNKH